MQFGRAGAAKRRRYIKGAGRGLSRLKPLLQGSVSVVAAGLNPQPRLLQYPTTHQHLIPPTRIPEQFPYLRPVILDFPGAAPVHHGEQVVAPAVAAGAAVAVAD